MSRLIYAADDEENIRQLIASFLEDAGYRVVTFATGDALYERFQQEPADLVVLDIMMPGTDGLGILKKLRAHSDVPVIMLTAKDSEWDYTLGIHSGSDDYLSKPFRPSHLSMRIKALFRRIDIERQKGEKDEALLQFGDLRLSHTEHQAYRDQEPIALTGTEFNQLAYLLRHSERAISRDELLNAIWGYEADVETRVADETVRRLRKKITASDSGVLIQTEWGYGYRLLDRSGS